MDHYRNAIGALFEVVLKQNMIYLERKSFTETIPSLFLEKGSLK